MEQRHFPACMENKQIPFLNLCCKLYTFNTERNLLIRFNRNRPKLPTIPDVIDSAVAELQDSLEPSKERFTYANGVLLQAARLMYNAHPHLIRKVYGAKKDIYKEMNEKVADTIMEDTNTTEDAKPTVSATPSNFAVGQNLTEDHVQAEIEVLSKVKQILLEEMEPKDEQGEKK